jgi:hypothetical protein
LTKPADVCDLRGAAPTSTLLPAIKHIYGLPYHNFDQADDEVRSDSGSLSRPWSSWGPNDLPVTDSTQSNNEFTDDNLSFASSGQIAIEGPSNSVPQPSDEHDTGVHTEIESVVSSESPESMYEHCCGILQRTLLDDKFFTGRRAGMSPDEYGEYRSAANFSKLNHHGDMYQCAESLRIPSLTAAIAANASNIFFESVGKRGFAQHLIKLFQVNFSDSSFLDAIADLCLKNLDLTFKDYEFSEDILQRSPFTGYLLLKVLTRDG